MASLESPRGLDLVLIAGGLTLAGLVALGALGSMTAPAGLDPSRDPLNLPALRERALKARAADQPGAARRLFDFIGRRSWRDAPAEAWLLRDHLIQGDFTKAFENADALLREDATGEIRIGIFPMLIEASAYAEARPALVARLAPAPWWRPAFLQHLAAEGDPAGGVEIFAALADTAHPATPEEYAPLINRLVFTRNYAMAETAWRRTTKAANSGPSTVNPLEIPETWDHTPFSWSIAEGVGAASDIAPAAAGEQGRSLHVDYDGAASPTLPSHLMVTEPGDHRLRWRARGNAAERLSWRVRCADTGQVLAREDPAQTIGESGWREVEMRFQTPSGGCAAQWLELVANPAERPSPVSVWYGDFRLTGAG